MSQMVFSTVVWWLFIVLGVQRRHKQKNGSSVCLIPKLSHTHTHTVTHDTASPATSRVCLLFPFFLSAALGRGRCCASRSSSRRQQQRQPLVRQQAAAACPRGARARTARPNMRRQHSTRLPQPVLPSACRGSATHRSLFGAARHLETIVIPTPHISICPPN